MRWLIAMTLMVLATWSAQAATVFQDGFEDPALGPSWTTGSTNNGRVSVTSANGPANGAQHLVLDDSVNDATSSVAEAVLHLNLTNKKNVVLSFNAKSLGNEPDYPPYAGLSFPAGYRTFDGVSISMDGGSTWRTVQSLATVGTAWGPFSITLDATVAAMAGSFGADFQIRFSEYDNAPVPEDGIAIDDVMVTADGDERTQFEIAGPVLEGSSGNACQLLLAYALDTDVTLQISASPSGLLTLPATVTIPARQTLADFTFGVADDSLVNLSRTVVINAFVPGITSKSAVITVLDDEPPVATLTLPAQVTEGETPTNNATVTIDRAATVPVTLILTALPATELSLPASVTIPAGQTQAQFTVQAADDYRIDGAVPVVVTASNPSMAPATASITALDNEQTVLSFALPAWVQEGSSATAQVVASGLLGSDLVVNLTSANPGAVTVPATATIRAGQAAGYFQITAADNQVRDGTRTVVISASAAGFTGASQPVTVRDNEVAGWLFSPIADMLDVGSPVTFTLTPVEVEGHAVQGVAGNLNLSLVLPDGSTQAVTPGTVTLSAGTWTGAITLPAVAAGPLRLRATDAAGSGGDSTIFDVMHVLTLTAADVVWDAARGRCYASVPASAPALANMVVAIDPLTQQITGSVAVGQNPRKLALTSGGEHLYVALDANGTIAKIDPDTMTVESSFAVGTSPYYGTLYVQDMGAVAGSPEMLVVSQYNKITSPGYSGVAVYDGGVMRAVTVPNSLGGAVLEPSGDPALWFAYDNQSSSNGFRQLLVDANGITQIQSNGSLVGGTTDLHADGGRVFSNAGAEVDGVQMRRLGAFTLPTGPGVALPDVAAHRVYYIEPRTLYTTTYDKIGAYDIDSFALARRLTFSPAVTISPATQPYVPGSFIRWGGNGLAFRTDSTVVFATSSQLVPDALAADLVATMRATPETATVGGTISYTVSVTNQGPATARNALLTCVLSDGQALQSAVAASGVPAVSGSTVSLFIGDIAVGQGATLILTTVPPAATSVSCTASVNASSVDPDPASNKASQFINVGFQPGLDKASRLRLAANNVLFDPTRQVLWATVPAASGSPAVESPLARSLVAVNPFTGHMGTPFQLNASAVASCIAVSGNGRYLYVGLSDAPEVLRVDLSTSPFTLLRIPLGSDRFSQDNHAQDLEVLDGDGTSFLMTGVQDHAAAVFDGTVRRADRTGLITVSRIGRTATPGVFAGVDDYSFTSLAITPTGVTATRTASSIITSYGDVRCYGDLVLTGLGRLASSSSLSLVANLGVNGAPCLDGPNHKAYLVAADGLYGFDTTTFAGLGRLALPVTGSDTWAQACVRWGTDGFAILSYTGDLYLARWSQVNTADANHNGIADSWENAHFNSLTVNMGADTDHDGMSNALEYLFGTAPEGVSSNPLKVKPDAGTQPTPQIQGQGINAIARTIVLSFPRRVGLPAGYYHYESSSDLQSWSTVVGVVEVVISTASVNGTDIENVEATVPLPASAAGFVRLVTAIP
ncbi:MAG: hypothetical protein JWO94_1653 [Verrucomicrobiaceae bacterium]|nr:hypothetical protein [Verrucomicrobiaceae bacterium]